MSKFKIGQHYDQAFKEMPSEEITGGFRKI